MLQTGFQYHRLSADLLTANLVIGVIVVVPGAVVAGCAIYAYGGLGRLRVERLAGVVDLGVPAAIEKKLRRFLLLRQLAILALSVLLAETLFAEFIVRSWTKGNTPASQLVPLLTVPIGLWIIGIVGTLWPHWTSTAGARLAHLRRPRVRDTLAPWEQVVVAAAYALQAGIVTLAVWEAGAPLRSWWMLPPVAIVTELAVTYAAARRTLEAAGGGHDGMELAWSDVLRFSRIRTLLALTSVFSLDWILISALDMLHAEHRISGALPPEMSVLLQIPLILGTAFFWKGPGVRQWQKAWHSRASA